VSSILSVILWLAGSYLQPHEARILARAVESASIRFNIETPRILSLIYYESRFNPRCRSRTHDAGIMQVHVSRNQLAQYLGRENELLPIRRNVLHGVAILSMWRDYHRRVCRSDHAWYLHYKYGKRIPRGKEAKSVEKKIEELYQRIRSKLDSYLGV
jgi:hypothetical protein